MADDTEADHVVPIDVFVTVLDCIERDAKECRGKLEANELWNIGAFICLVTSASLRGYEVLYMDISGLRSHLDKGREGVVPPELTHNLVLDETAVHSLLHVAIYLLGNFKGEVGVNYHTINIANESMSGLQTRWWVGKLAYVANQEGQS